MRPSSTARRYAEAAFDVAQQDGDVDGWLADLRTASEIAQRPEMSRYFKDPVYPTEAKLHAADEAFAGLRPHVLNLVRILVTRHRLHFLPAIAFEFERLRREARGITEAEVTVARPIDESEQANIVRRLAQLTGKQVEIHTRVDPGILGGLVVRMGDTLIDASVAGRLERLRHQIAV